MPFVTMFPGDNVVTTPTRTKGGISRLAARRERVAATVRELESGKKDDAYFKNLNQLCEKLGVPPSIHPADTWYKIRNIDGWDEDTLALMKREQETLDDDKRSILRTAETAFIHRPFLPPSLKLQLVPPPPPPQPQVLGQLRSLSAP